MKKFLKSPEYQRTGSKEPWAVLVGEVPIRNNAKDEVQEMAVKDRTAQTRYFVKNFPKVYPDYLMKYMKMMYKGHSEEDIKKIIDNSKQNKEATQVIGLIMLFYLSLRLAKKMNTGCRLYIIEPETHLHPKRQQAVMYVLDKIFKEHYPNGESCERTV